MTLLEKFGPPPTTPLLTRLRQHTAVWHEGQTYGEREPYTNHLDEVRTVLCNFNFSPTYYEHLNAIAELHDAKEDNPKVVSAGLLLDLGVPDYVVESVIAITDEPGSTRKERKARTYPKIRKNRDALIVKLADRIANVSRGGKLDMYRKEHEEFTSQLYFLGDQPLQPMWFHLNKLLA